MLEKRIIEWHGNKNSGSKKAFAEALGVTKNAVSLWCSGQAGIRKGAREKQVAELLGISVEELRSYQVGGNKGRSDSNVNFLQTDVFRLDKEAIQVYGKVTGESFKLSLDHPKEGTLPVTVKNPQDYIGLVVHGTGLEKYKLFHGDGIVIEKQGWALDGELVLVKLPTDDYSIRKYNKADGHNVEVVGVCRKKVSDL